MKNFGLLYKYELKKILKSRLTIAMMIVLLLTIVIEVLAPGLTEGFSAVRESAEAQKTLDGRVIDETLLNEMYPVLTDNGNTWNEENLKYRGIAYAERNSIRNGATLSDHTAAQMYEARRKNIETLMENEDISSQEKEWWSDKILSTEPFTFFYYQGSLILSQGLSGVLMVLMLISALCLSTVFTSEHRQKTDQLVLSCKNGRKETYLAKISAGLSVVTGASLIAALIMAVSVMALYGLDGLNAMVQLEMPMSAYSITVGRFILIQMGTMVTAGLLFASFSMAFSEILKNSLAVAGIMVGLFIFSQLEIIPHEFRFLKLLNMMIPSNQISVWSLMEHQLIRVGGQFFTRYAVSPVAYILLSLFFLLTGWISYHRFQVTGR